MAARDIIQAAGGSAATSAATYVEDVFSTYLYSGTEASKTITNGIDLSTKGGMVWIKARSFAFDHVLVDTARGASNTLSSNLTSAQSSDAAAVTSFNTDGFSLGADSTNGRVNTLNATIASWTFRKQAKFFDIVTYTGDGASTKNISHNLGATPGMIIVKRTDSTGWWMVYHKSTGATKYLGLQSTAAADIISTVWSDTSPTSSVFTVGSSNNASGATYVAYLFADSNSGGFGPAGTDSVVACGSFTTDGSGNVGTVSLGWEPQFLLVKRTDSIGNWLMFDTMRGLTVAGSVIGLQANSSGAELDYGAGTSKLYPTSTGFAGSSYFFADVADFIYLAIRRGPMKTPTDATKVFAPVLASGNGVGTTGFPVDTFFVRAKAGGGGLVNDRLRGSGSSLFTTGTSAEDTGYNTYFDNNTGVNNQIGIGNPISWNFRRAPGFFDVVCYTGTGSATTVAHNLGVAPELMIVKSRSLAIGWLCYHKDLGAANGLYLNTDAIPQYVGWWNSTTPTSSVFSLGGSSGNNSGATFIAYLFASAAGVSKVGSYTGTGTTKQIDCGFTAGARFVLIKRTDSTGSWYVWDTARGIVSGNDPYLLLNSTAAEVTNTDYIDPYSAGFEISSTAPAEINASGGTYIYLAIA